VDPLPGFRTVSQLQGIDPSRVPKHIAAVMDGNGRWATQRGLKRTEGHAAGEEALFDAVEGALELGLDWFTVYAFSTENWRRPLDEVRFLMNFNDGILVRHRDQLNDWGVRIRFAGRRDWRVPRRVLRRIEESEDLTRRNKRMTFTVAFNYGGRAEIIDAARTFQGSTEEEFRAHLYAPEMHDPDLIIRTSGEQRLSNYLMWQSAYSELHFTDVLWPDFSRADLEAALAEFDARKRRFGGR